MKMDGTIEWGVEGPKPAANGFDIEARSNSIYEWIRQVRGGVLAGVFTIESNLNTIILFFMLGSRVQFEEVVGAFEEGLLSQLSFDRRITIVRLITPHFLPLEDAKSLRSDLSELRTIRNAMAHNPFWFEPKINREGKVDELVPYIRRGKGTIPVTSALIDELNQKIRNLIEKTSSLAKIVQLRESTRL